MGKLNKRQRIKLADISESFRILRRQLKNREISFEDFEREMAGVEDELNKYILEN